jgi:hypothetical protein
LLRGISHFDSEHAAGNKAECFVVGEESPRHSSGSVITCNPGSPMKSAVLRVSNA